MKSEEFKHQFKKYQLGTLSEKEEKEMEDELEKLDEYQSFLEVEMGNSQPRKTYESDTEKRILKRSQFFAYFRIGIVSVVISLLLLPTLNFLGLALDIIP